MKKSYLRVGVATIAVAFAACSQEEDILTSVSSNAKQTYEFQAVLSPETRTTFNADFSGLDWTEGDVIGFYTNADANVKSTPVESGYFSAELSGGASEVYAYYPYSETATYGNSEVYLSIQSIQRQTETGVLNGANLPMQARARLSTQGVTTLEFTPHGSVIAFNVYHPNDASEYVESVSFTANEHMTSGDCTINWSTGAAGSLSYYRRMATVGLAYESTLSADKPTDKSNYIYLVVASDRYTTGGTVTVATNKTVYYFDYTTSLDLSDVYNVQTLSLDLQRATRTEQVLHYGNESFPDPIFRQYVLDEFDINQDGSLSTAELAVAENIVCNGVSSFEGIELFKNLRFLQSADIKFTGLDITSNTQLEQLSLSGTGGALRDFDLSKNTELEFINLVSVQLDRLDLSQNTKLITLYCGFNQLRELDLSHNTALRTLSFWDNELTELDVSKNVNLRILQLPRNQLTSIDVKNNTELVNLILEGNQLKELDVTRNTKLTTLDVSENQLTELNLSQNNSLVMLDCSNNSLSGLDVSGKPELEYLYCYNCGLENLDVSGNSRLTILSCSYNLLKSLDVSNNSLLSTLSCSYNLLSELDISNCAQHMEWFDCSSQASTIDGNGNYVIMDDPVRIIQAEDQTFGYLDYPEKVTIETVKVDR